MPKSKLNKLRNMSKKPKLPEKKSDFCLGECKPKVVGKQNGKPVVYCYGGCGRRLN